jgi:hypothetical protein
MQSILSAGGLARPETDLQPAACKLELCEPRHRQRHTWSAGCVADPQTSQAHGVPVGGGGKAPPATLGSLPQYVMCARMFDTLHYHARPDYVGIMYDQPTYVTPLPFPRSHPPLPHTPLPKLSCRVYVCSINGLAVHVLDGWRQPVAAPGGGNPTVCETGTGWLSPVKGCSGLR